jgi:hypothetical protein
MLGLFGTWILEIWYISCVALLALKFDVALLREVAAVLKDFDFVLIPLIQILTSAPIKKAILSNTTEKKS